jgi:hypothetical protein
MPRKAKANAQSLDDEVIRCYIDDHGREVTTIAERRDIAEQWCKGNYVHHHEIASKRRLLPIALLIASLIEIDHPLLVSPGRGVVYNAVDCAVIIMDVMLKNKAVATPASAFNLAVVERMEQGQKVE